MSCSYFNPENPKSDQYQISYSNTAESFIKVMGIMGMMVNLRGTGLFTKFSLSGPLEMYRKQYG